MKTAALPRPTDPRVLRYDNGVDYYTHHPHGPGGVTRADSDDGTDPEACTPGAPPRVMTAGSVEPPFPLAGAPLAVAETSHYIVPAPSDGHSVVLLFPTLSLPPMANASILVPGTGGTTLMDNSGRDVGYPIKMRLGAASKGLLGLPAEAFRELLSMEHIPGQIAPAKTSLKPGTSLRPGHVLEVAYNQIPREVNHFLYDWRADLRYSAGKLLDFLEHRRPTGGRWNVVGHSQGALLIVLASKMMGDPEAFSRLVASATLVGAPMAGTINSYQALLTGEAAGKPAAGTFKEILRTWPALYQMLPAWPSLCTAPGVPCPDDEQLMTLKGWTGVPGIREEFLQRGLEVHTLLRDPLSHMRGDIRVGVLLARNRNTGVEVRRNGDLLDPEPITRQKGDGLVPLERTISWVGDHVRRFVVAFDAPAREHAFMLSDPAIATTTRQQFR